MIKNSGKIILITGPSGVGKTTIGKELYNSKDINSVFSVSYTTRKKRFDEVDGKNYFFITKDQFEKKVRNNDFLEYAKYVDEYYGTSKEQVEKLLSQRKNVFVEVEIQGALQLINKIDSKKMITIFILPPTFEKLISRLANRMTDDDKKIEMRIKQAKIELKSQDLFQHKVINENIDDAIENIKKIVKNSE